ncbi:MAG: UvrD-helicase domain-containing protein, partial [Rhodospirillales bacterium]|nr:UvrD-helicase domain-containing protein [Rhodospirillales bacterium]
HIFAVETGLSSDPEMNWRISSLDRFRLVSNSDAHSPPKIAREATTYDTALDYFAIQNALKTGDGFVGTVEFFPEEGKYHMDGHRKCGVRFAPEETKAHGGNCPVCGKPLTVGVLHRVDALADRPNNPPPPPTAGEVLSLVPLPEILSEMMGVGVGSKKVGFEYERLLARLGPELSILESVPQEEIAEAGTPVLAEAISRLRTGQVIREPGYDGEYGVIRLFEEEELRHQKSGGLLFDLPAPLPENKPGPSRPDERENSERKKISKPQISQEEATLPSLETGLLAGLDDAQRAAVETLGGPLLIVAGPGSGKTRALTHRIAHLITEHGAPPEACLAITFTRRAAAEMEERLTALVPTGAKPPIHTFHSLGLSILREQPEAAGLNDGFRIADEEARLELLSEVLDVSARKARTLLRSISVAKRTGCPPDDDSAKALKVYQKALAARGWIDFDDLIGLAVAALEANTELAEIYRTRFRWISVDEFQDVDAQQYRFVRLLAPPDANLCVIGDPNQAIYGFRGADAACFRRFTVDYPDAAEVKLTRNYRSSGTIVTASSQVINTDSSGDGIGLAMRDMLERVTIHAARSEKAEAEFVVQVIENMLGGHSFFSIDSGRGAEGAGQELSFSDFAVLYRTDAQSGALSEALARSGMPFGKHGHAPLAEVPVVQALMAEFDGDRGTEPIAARLRQAADRHANTSEAAVQQLLGLAEICGNDLHRFIDAVALASESDGWDPRADRISLLTLHAAKGLEFPVVFVVGLEDGILPLHWGGGGDDAADEERRLFYVGMTRARDSLFLCRAEKRFWNGASRMLPASPFLNDIETALVEHSRMKARSEKEADRQLDLF